jgi:prepilin-type processing-associated H-X9-DG protein
MSHNSGVSQAEPPDAIGLRLGLFDDANRLDDETASAAGLNKIKQGLFLLSDDGLELQPPPRLAEKTLAKIQRRATLQEHFRETVIPRQKWRFSDIAVAASIMFAMFLGSFPALNRAKFTASNLACSSNLAQLWQGAELYSKTFNAYPSAVAQNQQMPAGAMLVLMRHTGHLSDSVPLTCPGCDQQVQAHQLPNWTDIEKDFALHSQKLESALKDAYAVHPGLGGPTGMKHLNRSLAERLQSHVPIFGDHPAPTNFWAQLHLNSDSHGGHGQNVIFADGHVEFSKSRRFHSRHDDIYTNHQGNVSPPSSPDDMMLVPAWFKFGR